MQHKAGTEKLSAKINDMATKWATATKFVAKRITKSLNIVFIRHFF